MQKLKIYRSAMMMCIIGIAMLFVLSACMSTTNDTSNNSEDKSSLPPTEQQVDICNGTTFDYAPTTTLGQTASPDISQMIIGNNNSLVYHAPNCNSLPSEKNRVYFESAAEAEQAGMHPHKECIGE